MASSDPSGKLKSQKMTVVAELHLTWTGGEQTVRSFDTAWHLMLELAAIEGNCPVNCKLMGFVHKTKAELAQPL